MSIEKNIERIADALEGLLALARGGEAPQLGAQKPGPATAPAKDAIPGLEEEAPAAAEGGVKTGQELRDLAQKYIQVAGDKTGALVTFIQSVAKIFNAKEPKLIKIPDAKVAEAAKMIEEWCTKKSITLPIEV